MQLPRWQVYCTDTTEVNALAFDLGDIRVYFSYNTPIAFRYIPKTGTQTLSKTIVRENTWGPTTGKHMSAIDGGDKKSRVSSSQFETLLQELLDN
jgi:hypothetical protein